MNHALRLRAKPLATLLLSLCVGAASACQSAPKRIPPPPIEGWKQMIYGSAEKLLDEERKVRGPQGGADEVWVAVLPIKYSGNLAAGSNNAALYAGISEAVVNSRLFQPISRDLVEVAVKESNIADPRRLLAKKPRQAFLSVLNDSGFVPEYLILPELTTLVTQDSRGTVTAREASINLQLIDSLNGATAQQQSDSYMQQL